MFAGKDFLKMQPPKDYKPGIGRGALRFSTRGNIGFVDVEPVDDRAAEIYANVDKRRKRKGKNNEAFEDAREEPPQFEIDWMALPEASDMTFRNKRLRAEEISTKRTYSLPDSMLNSDLDGPNFAQLTKIDPQNPKGWIGYARQEHDLKHFKRARTIIEKGCRKCSLEPSVWLCALDLSPGLTEKRTIVAKAVETLPHEIALWKYAIEIEVLDSNKLKVVHQSLEANPESAELWTLAAQFEPDSDVRLMVLQQAVDLVPGHEELWLSLYEADYQESTLDRALDIHPQSTKLWARKVYLHENARSEYIDELLKKLPDGDWSSIVNKHPASKISAQIVERFKLPVDSLDPSLQSISYKLLATEDSSAYVEWATKTGDREALELAVKHNPTISSWKLFIEFDNSMEILQRAYKEYPREFMKQYISRLDASEALDILRSAEKDEQMWHEYVELLDGEEAIKACKSGLEHYPNSGQLYLRLNKLEPSKKTLQLGTQKAPECLNLWLEYAKNEPIPTQRSILTQAHLHNPKNEHLWAERLALEKSAGKSLMSLLESALKECPRSGLLWFEYLQSLDDIKRKPAFARAIKETGSHPEVLFALGLFYHSRGKKEAKEVLEKAAQGSKNARVWLEEHPQACR